MEVKCRKIHDIAKKEMQIPSVERESKVQDTVKAFIHLYSFITLNCKHQFKVSKRNGVLTLLLCLLL